MRASRWPPCCPARYVTPQLRQCAQGFVITHILCVCLSAACRIWGECCAISECGDWSRRCGFRAPIHPARMCGDDTDIRGRIAVHQRVCLCMCMCLCVCVPSAMCEIIASRSSRQLSSGAKPSVPATNAMSVNEQHPQPPQAPLQQQRK
jgi:hypothetical protein